LVRPGSRDSNRFFSRLGFAPLAVRRAAPVSSVRRRLAQTEHGVATPLSRRRPRRPSLLMGTPAPPQDLSA
jgi:hypothetical protein